VEHLLLHILLLASAGVWAVMIAWVASPYFASADILSHCAFHTTIGLTILFAVCTFFYFLRRKSVERGAWIRRMLLLGLPLPVLLYATQPWTMLPLTKDASTTRPTTKILVWNVYMMNRNFAQVAETIEKLDPDIVALIECSPEMGDSLDYLRQRYKTDLWNPSWQSQSMIVMTKFDDAKLSTQHLAGMHSTMIEFTPKGSSQRHHLHAIHTYSPNWPGGRVHQRNKQFDKLIALMQQSSETPTIVMGDFNTSPWSRSFSKFQREGKLIDTRLYRGNLPTWPSFFGDFGIPIDHAMVTSEVKVHRRYNINDGIGSDHKPIVLELAGE
jgi:endonuclease/exonuclease/phosphatase (EEP) superfamily protein YafD